MELKNKRKEKRYRNKLHPLISLPISQKKKCKSWTSHWATETNFLTLPDYNVMIAVDTVVIFSLAYTKILKKKKCLKG